MGRSRAAHHLLLLLARHEQVVEEIGDDDQQEAADHAVEEAERAVERADRRVEHPVGDLDADQRHDDQHHQEHPGAYRDLGGNLLRNILRHGHDLRVEGAGKTGESGDAPGDQRQHLAGEAAGERQEAGNQHDRQDDKIRPLKLHEGSRSRLFSNAHTI